MTADSNILTFKDYLSGKVRDIDIPDPTLASILLDAGCDTVTYEKKVEDEDAPSEATDDSDEQSEESGETPKETHTYSQRNSGNSVWLGCMYGLPEVRPK